MCMEGGRPRQIFSCIQSSRPCPKYMDGCYNTVAIHNGDRRREKKRECYFVVMSIKTFYFQKILVSSAEAVLYIVYSSFILYTMWPTLRGHQQSPQQNGRNKGRLVMQEQLLVFSSITWEFFTSSFSASLQMFSLLCAGWVFTVQDYGGGGNILPIV